MEHINHITKKSFNLYTVSDIHIGSLFCIEDKIVKMVEEIKQDPDGIAYLNGDLIQGFTKNHKNFEHRALVGGLETPIEQAEQLVDILMPIKDKIVGAGMGNHELDCYKRAGDIVKHNICKPLGVPYGGYKSIVTFDTRSKYLFKGLYHHGFGSVNSRNLNPKKRREANENSLVAKLVGLGHPDCAFNSMGHFHKIICVKPEMDILLTEESSMLKQLHNAYDFATQTSKVIPVNKRFFGCSGCYEVNQVDGVSGYSEIAGYSPAVLGSIKLEVRDELITDLIPIYK